MLNFSSILLFSENPTALVEFYKKVFEKEPDWFGGDFSAFQVGTGSIVIGPHEKVKGPNSNPERIMFNLETEDILGEFDRIKGLGTKVIADPYHPKEEENDEEGKIGTFEDPDGNFFQLMTPWKP